MNEIDTNDFRKFGDGQLNFWKNISVSIKKKNEDIY